MKDWLKIIFFATTVVLLATLVFQEILRAQTTTAEVELSPSAKSEIVGKAFPLIRKMFYELACPYGAVFYIGLNARTFDLQVALSCDGQKMRGETDMGKITEREGDAKN